MVGFHIAYKVTLSSVVIFFTVLPAAYSAVVLSLSVENPTSSYPGLVESLGSFI